MSPLIIGIIACAFLTYPTSAQTRKEPPYLVIARQLVSDLQHDAKVNVYGSSPTFLRWGHPTREARTVCATFVTRLFEHTYGCKETDIKHWLGATGADAVEWHQAIASENGFQHLTTIAQIHPGDILAIKYDDGSDDTGHIMIVDHDPEPIVAISPIEKDTEQYEVEVIDSSASGHGPTDTRHKAGGGFTGGIGKGMFRLYANPDGSIAGYAWSETPKSKFYRSPARDMVAGHLTFMNSATSSHP